MTGKDLKKAFWSIRNEWFPRWDREGEWKIFKNEKMIFHGQCDKEKKIISINPNIFEPQKLSLVIMHEICHSSSCRHGKIWQKRMLKLAEKVSQKDYSLSRQLIADVEGYQNTPNPYKQVYNMIEDWVFENPELSYDEIMKGLERDFGSTRKEFEKKYKKCRRIYNEAQKGVNS